MTDPRLEWRAPTADDVPAWTSLLAAIEATDVTGENHTEEDCADEFATPWMRPDVNAWFGFTGPGDAVAFGWVSHPPGAARYERIELWGGVHPHWRGRGIGTHLMGWLEARACQRLAEVDSSLPPAIRVSAIDTNEGAQRLFSKRGFEPVRYFSDMRRDLARPLPEARPPQGARIAPFAEADDESLRLVHNEVFADHWGSEPIEPDDWRQWVTGHRNFRGDLSAVAFAPSQDPREEGEELAGYVLSAVYPQDFEAQGYTEGWINTVGVRRPWRRRGLARALLVTVMGAIAADGLECAGLGVDTASPTGALGLYEGLGFTAEKRSITFELPQSGRSPSPPGGDRPR